MISKFIQMLYRLILQKQYHIEKLFSCTCHAFGFWFCYFLFYFGRFIMCQVILYTSCLCVFPTLSLYPFSFNLCLFACSHVLLLMSLYLLLMLSAFVFFFVVPSSLSQFFPGYFCISLFAFWIYHCDCCCLPFSLPALLDFGFMDVMLSKLTVCFFYVPVSLSLHLCLHCFTSCNTTPYDQCACWTFVVVWRC